jgi:hypothetical protein
MSNSCIDCFQSKTYTNSLLQMINDNIFSTCQSEEDIRKKFENETNRVLTAIGALQNGEYITFKSEVDTFDGGRIDSKYKNLIIEYKKYSRLDNPKELEKAKNQLFDYLKDPQFAGKNAYGILFDGKTINIYYKNEKQEFEAPNKHLNGHINLQNLDFYFKAAFLRDKRELSSVGLKEDFGIENNKNIMELYRLFFNSIKKAQNKRTELMINEWEKMFKLSESDNTDGLATHPDIKERRSILSKFTNSAITQSKDEYMAIFCLHTLFSIILKLLLVKSVNEFKDIFDNGKSFNDAPDFSIIEMKKFFTSIENGTLLNKAGLSNMLEGDFFSWYIKENSIWTDEFVQKLKNVVAIISQYEDARLKTYSSLQDLFRELYESFIPRIIRHCFGEYYTPYWLADNVVISTTSDKKPFCSVLDPCCGSGTFLISVLNHRLELINKDHSSLETKLSFSKLLEGIYGIDLNPLAVLMARINIFINCASHITDYSTIELPIYNGDSTYSPTIRLVDGVVFLDYSLNTTIMGDRTFDISLPYKFVESDNFSKNINDLEGFILSQDDIAGKKFLITQVKKCIGTTTENIEHLLSDEVDKLIGLEKQELNGIWLRIFANYLKTGVIPKVDCIVGNPPWVRWNILPENYRLTVKTKCKLDGLFSDDKNFGGVDLNICALIANKCCEKWLSQSGTLSFLMPQNLLFNKSFEGFRRYEITVNGKTEHCFIQNVVDWTKSGDPFGEVKEKFCTYNISFKKQDYLEGIDYIHVKKFDKTHLLNNQTWDEAKSHFVMSKTILCALPNENNNNFSEFKDSNEVAKVNQIIGKNFYNFRKGVDAQAPMRLKFKTNIDDTLAEFYRYQKVGKRIKLTSSTIVLEKQYIRPYITAPMIQRNKLNWEHDYIICTYKGNKEPIQMRQLEKECPRLAIYLKSNQVVLSNRSKFNKRIQNNTEFWALTRTGKYCFFNDFVCIRDNTKFVSAHVGAIMTDWEDLKTPFFDGHVSFISESKKGSSSGISYDEAEYINYILNLSIVGSYILSSSSLRSIGTRFNILIPQYNLKMPAFSRFLENCKNDKSELTIEKEYLKLLKEV